MAGKFISELAESMGWKAEDDAAYGICMGIPFNVRRDVNGAAFTTAWLSEPAQVDDRDLLQFLQGKKKEHRTMGMPQKTGASITVQQNKAFGVMHAEEVKNFVREFAAFLAGKGVKAGCATCGRTEHNDFYTLEGGHIYLCPECSAAVTAAKAEEIQAAAKGNNALGILGAILGGIAGIIPMALVGLAGYVAAFCGVLMAFCIYYGFKLFRGKLNSRAFIIVTVVLTAIVMTYLATMATTVVMLANSLPGAPLDLIITATFMMPFDPAAAAETGVWGFIGQAYLFAALGIGAWIFDLNRKMKNQRKPVKKAGS